MRLRRYWNRLRGMPGEVLSGVVLMFFVGASAWTLWNRTEQPLPVPAVRSSTVYVSESRCVECHSDITEGYSSAPHSRTLNRANDPSMLHLFAGRSFRRADDRVEFHYTMVDDHLHVTSSAYARPLKIDWIFGSGTHAWTPLITWEDETGNTFAIEHSVSCYPTGGSGGELGVTLGMEKLEESSGILVMGHPRPPSETKNCFGCHVSSLPMIGNKIDFEHIQPGISCSRCHWKSAEHVRDMELELPSRIERFSTLSPREAVDRCGECHRRADELGGPLDPEDTTLARFASVGLVQSPCFQRQGEVRHSTGTFARLDCTSCHDPHRPSSRDWRIHVAVCLNCHSSAQAKAIDCSVASRESNCLQCHMPKVPANDHLEFTDHWIRRPSPRQVTAE